MRKVMLVIVSAVCAVAIIAPPAAAHQPHRRSEAVEVGDYHNVGKHWRVKVTRDRWKITSDAYGDGPSRGYDFLVVRVRTLKTTSGEGSPYWDLNFDLYGGRSKRLYTSLGDCSPNDWIGSEDSVFRGGSVTANVCFEVKENDSGFRLRVEDAVDFVDAYHAWYRVK